MRLAKRLSVLMFASMLSLAACGGTDDDTPACTAPTGTDYTYVVNELLVPTNAADATTLSLDLDGTMPIRNDNALGTALANLANQAGLDIGAAVDTALAQGDVILLVNVKTEDLTNTACAGVGVYLGTNPGTLPCTDVNDVTCGNHLDGTTTFELDPASPTDTQLPGQILGGQFDLGPNDAPGEFTIELDLIEGADPITLNLVGARLKITSVTADGLTGGILGGALKKEDILTSVIPAVSGLVTDTVQADCGGTAPDCCTVGSAGELIVQFFDDNGDCTVSDEELQNSDVVATILNPDLNLYDETGAYNPNVDLEADSLSLGLGFSAVGAVFTPPQ